VTGVASSGRARAKTDLRRRVVGLSSRAVWVGGEKAGGSHLRACAARVAGAAAAVMFIACERNGTARSVGDTVREAGRRGRRPLSA
jgi:hypothetical protein